MITATCEELRSRAAELDRAVPPHEKARAQKAREKEAADLRKQAAERRCI